MKTIKKRISVLIGITHLIALTAISHSQEIWQKLDFHLDDAFVGNERFVSRVFFRDTTTGFISTTTSTNDFQTSDGGGSWNFSRTPTPHTIYSDGYGATFGSGQNEYFSTDNGSTWKLIQPFIDNSLIKLDFISSSNGGQGGTLLALAETSQRLQTPNLDTITAYHRRLLLSTDAGASWQFGDSIRLYHINGNYYSEISPATPYGSFPIPPDFDKPTEVIVDWNRTFDVPDSQTVRVIATVKGLINNQSTIIYYLGRIHLSTKTTEWNRLPFWQNVNPTLIDFRTQNYFRRNLNNALFIVDFVKDTNRPGLDLHYIHHSIDDGKTWTSTLLPDYVDAQNISFISNSHWVAFKTSDDFLGGSISYRTFDAGKTWQSFHHPVSAKSKLTGYALDSLHYYVVGTGIVFAWSNDAGTTWQRNTPVEVPITTVTACRGNVLVGRYHRSILLSNDSGATWKDIGTKSEIPSGFLSLVAATFVDTSKGSNRIVGIAQFNGDTSAYVAAVRSNDGGATWDIASNIRSGYSYEPQLLAVPTKDQQDDRLFLYGESLRGLLQSNDNGTTWEQLSTIDFQEINMMDRDTGIGRSIKHRPDNPDTLLRTTDGGKTWRVVHVGLAYGMHRFSNGEWVAISETENGNKQWGILRSNNHGETWSSMPGSAMPSSFRIQEVQWRDHGEVYLIGSDATIYYSADSLRSTILLQGKVEELSGDLKVAVDGIDAYFYTWNRGWDENHVVARRRLTPDYTTSTPDVAESFINYRISNGEILIDGNSENIFIELYDMLGKIVYQKTLQGCTQERVQLPSELCGYYFCRIGSQNKNKISAVFLQ